MPNPSEEKEPDAFEHVMERTIADIDSVIAKSIGGVFADGQKSGLECALTIYRECRKDGTI